MHTRPTISVVIIFYNAAPFLAEAVESVLAQTYQDWELLLVDDGSTDGSTVIAQGYATGDPLRVRYLEHPGHANRGMSASRNLGVAEAAGTYVAFLDADDVWMPSILAEQLQILEQFPEAALVYGPIEYWYSWTGRPQDRERDSIERLGVPAGVLIPPPTLLPLFLQDRAAVPSGLLVRRAAIIQVGGFDEAFRGEYEDQVFCAKVCLQLPVVAATQCWYRYRQHPGSCVARSAEGGRSVAARRRFLEWLAAYISTQGICEPEVLRALQAELWPHHYPTLYRLATRVRHMLGQVSSLLGPAKG